MDTTEQGYEMPNQAVLEQQMDSVQRELQEVRNAMTKMAEAITKLSVLEERNLAANAAIEKLIERQDRLESKIGSIELEQVKFESTVKGVTGTMKWMWGAFGGGVVYIGAQAVKFFG